MNRRLLSILAFAIPVCAVVYWLWANSRANTKSPRYRLLRMEGEVEIRDYPLLTVVNAPMSGDEMDSGFGKLFRYITGENHRAEKIEMTTPVLVSPAEGARAMSFIMPPGAMPQNIPAPADGALSVGEIAGGAFAALRFPGGQSPENERRAIASLKSLLTRRELETAGPAMIAYYDPPWTPLFLRRNEVLIPLAAK